MQSAGRPVNFGQRIYSVEGEPMREVLELDADGRPARVRDSTLATCCIHALGREYPEERLDGEEKLSRYRLARRIHGSVVEEKPLCQEEQEVALLKRLIAATFPPFISGQVWEMLELGEG